ncbi:hypothetical protein L1987_02124 [Smallanthus sonchifolius]|uniref:Uncharacterized protein n=1 Tax=Smallanthus sonchifolius TaxID=185202 RepID=A0ACB9K6Y9_9ASTR|nr:hypothetical protein L1987_02124 [Smallanthus sonchifolius]
MCKGTGKVMYQVKNYTLRSGEKATAEATTGAIAKNRAELENTRYDQLRDVVAKRKPGWEYLQLPRGWSQWILQARNDPVELNVPQNASTWSEEDLKGCMK